jgi:uncharacterized membrane protein YhaH (DUF805 family)
MTNARQLLEERFARGEISTAEYQERMAVLNDTSGGQVPPHRVVGFGDAVGLALRNYVNFSGRSSRAAYWFFVLAAILLGFVTGFVDAAWFGWGVDDPQPLSNLVSLLLFLPWLGLAVRRLHDVNRSGWWLLLVLTVIGIIPLLFWLCQQGDRFTNRFGPDAEAGR